MRVTTNRPIFHGGQVTSEIETTDQHARELEARGLISVRPKPTAEIQKTVVVAKPKPRNGN